MVAKFSINSDDLFHLCAAWLGYLFIYLFFHLQFDFFIRVSVYGFIFIYLFVHSFIIIPPVNYFFITILTKSDFLPLLKIKIIDSFK